MAKTDFFFRLCHRKYYRVHKQKMLAQARKWREENIERVRANRKYNRTHLRLKTYNREYYLKNRDKTLKYQREYRLKKLNERIGKNVVSPSD